MQATEQVGNNSLLLRVKSVQDVQHYFWIILEFDEYFEFAKVSPTRINCFKHSSVFIRATGDWNYQLENIVKIVILVCVFLCLSIILNVILIIISILL